jgi:hypothetical protein
MRSPDSNRGHHDFQMLAEIGDVQESAVTHRYLLELQDQNYRPIGLDSRGFGAPQAPEVLFAREHGGVIGLMNCRRSSKASDTSRGRP